MAMQMSDAPTGRHPQSAGRNEGSIWWRPNRRAWIAEVSLPNGRSRTAQRNTRADAKRALKTLLATVNAPPALPPNCSLGRYLRYWLAETVDDRDPATNRGYAGIVENHVIRQLGRIRLDRLTVRQLEAYYAFLATESGLAPQTVKNHRMVLCSAFADAERWSVIPRGSNPAAVSRTPPVPKVPRQTLSLKQIKRVLEDDAPGRLHALFVLSLCSGAREAELLGLVWPDVDEHSLHLNFQLARQHGEWVRKPLKTGRVREVELPALAIEALARHRARQLAERAAAGLSETYEGLVFTTAGGAPLHVPPVLAEWYATLERVGLPRVTFHDGRHSYVSALMHLGVDWRVSADQTGHSTAAMQKHYSHGTPESRQLAAASLQAGLEAAG